jgi:hypothetical protein
MVEPCYVPAAQVTVPRTRTHARLQVTITARLKRKKGARTDKTVTGYCNESFLSQSKLVSLSERPVLGDGSGDVTCATHKATFFLVQVFFSHSHMHVKKKIQRQQQSKNRRSNYFCLSFRFPFFNNSSERWRVECLK